MLAHLKRCAGSLGEMDWLIGRDVLAHLKRCSGSLGEMGWLIG